MTPEQERLLHAYEDAVQNAPAHLHLTSEKDRAEFWERHILDAWTLLESLPPLPAQARAIDIGTGNGIPGLVASVRYPDWQVILIDSDTKKCGFIDVFCKNHSIKNVSIICQRAESESHGSLRETQDIAFARALGELPVALELAASFIKVGGILIVPHGTSWPEHLKASKNAKEALSLEFSNHTPYKWGDNQSSTFLTFKKVKPTPDKYPRAVGMPKRKPL